MMKKVTLTLVITACFTLSAVLGVNAVNDIRLIVNNKEIAAPVEILDGTSYVPLRTISEILGAEVQWNEGNRTIHINHSFSSSGSSMGRLQLNDGGAEYPVDVHINSGPMTLHISKVALSPAYTYDPSKKAIQAMTVTVDIENTSNEEVIWNVVRGQAVLNTREYIQTGSPFLSDQVDGKFYGKQNKQGNIVFELKGEINNITSFTYIIDSPLGLKTDYLVNVGSEEAVHIVLRK